MTILFFGDIMGKIGRKAVKKILPGWKKKYKPDFVIANGENLAHGVGVTEKTAREVFETGVDFLTGGNHSLKRESEFHIWDESVLGARMIRPANLTPSSAQGGSASGGNSPCSDASVGTGGERTPESPPCSPDKIGGIGGVRGGETIRGQGFRTVDIKGQKLLIINLIGRVFFKEEYADPFGVIDEILGETASPRPWSGGGVVPSSNDGSASSAKGGTAIILDFHAEATSEKNALGWYLDGRVSAVIGTHTHIPTCDEKILPKGTAYITDVGMVGAKDSVLGVDKSVIIEAFLNDQGFKHILPEEGEAIVSAVLLKINSKTGKAEAIKRLEEVVEV